MLLSQSYFLIIKVKMQKEMRINMNTEYNSQEYKRSRTAYMAQCTFEYLVSLLVTDAFLSKLLTDIGIAESLIGIISSLISFSFLFQLLSIFLVSKMKNTKKTVLFFDTLSQVFFMGIYLIPFLPIGLAAKTVLAVLGILIAYIGKYMIISIFFKWANSYVEPGKRGEYSAVKEMISLFCGIVFTLIIGYIIDRYEAIGNIHGGFLFTAAAMLILNVCNFISILMIKNEHSGQREERTFSAGDVVRNTLGNKNFRNVIIMASMWNIARYTTVGFLGTFKTNDLLISVGRVQIINMAANLIRLAVSKPLGRYADKTSYAKCYKLALILSAVGFAFNIFTTKSTWWCIVLYTVFYNVSVAGTNQNSHNITYSYVKKDYIVQAMAIKSSIAGILGFCASICGSRILSAVQNNNNTVFGIHIYGQQLLSAISVIIIITAVIFIKKVIEKQEIMLQ